MQKQPVKKEVVTFGKLSYILPYISIIIFGLIACNSKPGTEKQKSLGFDINTIINMFYLGEHELNIYGSMMYRHEDYEEAIKLIASGKIITAPLLTKTFPFENYIDAYKFIEQQCDKTMKVMIDL